MKTDDREHLLKNEAAFEKSRRSMWLKIIFAISILLVSLIIISAIANVLIFITSAGREGGVKNFSKIFKNEVKNLTEY